MISQTARQRVLATLQKRKTATAAQIGVALGMSAATVRHHLGILVSDGRVVAERSGGTRKRGRPEKRYKLSERVRGENFALLADAVLDSWLGSMPEAGREAVMRKVAERLDAQLGRIDGSLPATKKLVQLREKLIALHYEAGWEAGADGPRVVFGHCPYAAIIGRHPELCKMDEQLLGLQMSARAEQLAKIEQKPGGTSHCVFALRERR